MRPCTTVKPLALALFLGALSVVAHSLPERRSEINIRAPGGHKFSDPLTKPEDVDDKGVSDATTDATSWTFRHPLTDYCSQHYPHNHTPLIQDVGDLKQLLKGLDLVVVSEDVLDGKIYTGTYSISTNTTSPKPDTNLKKRNNIEGAPCRTICYSDETKNWPDSNDCVGLYQTIFSTSGQFTVAPSTSPSLPHF